VQATDSKLITCAGYVPTGWLKTDFYDSDNLCGGDPFVQNQDNVWVIERYDNKPEGTTMQVCVGFQPYDWVKTDITTSSVKCGRYTNITNNVWTLYKLRATDDKVTTCSGYVPDNFLKVDFYPQSYRCGLDYNTSTYNMWTIQRYNDKSIGTTLKACAGFTPTGWTRLSISSSSTQCGRGTGLYDNIWTLRRDY
jgi:hypothetical protein